MKTLKALVILSAGVMGLASCKKEDQLTKVGNEVAGKANSISSSSQEASGQGAVYFLDNATNDNHVVAFTRSTSGQLSSSGSFSTGGMGTGSGTGSQGAVILDNSGQYLFAVNAGSHDISSFRVSAGGLTWIDKIPSGGTMPISLTIHEDVLYVVNAGGTGNIHGFRVNEGDLTDITGSNQSLSNGAAGPAQIQFNSEGTALVVTEKNTNMIDVFPVSNGIAGARKSFPSVGITPFGFAFGKNDEFFVSDAHGGELGLSALSPFSLNETNDLHAISGPVATTQTSACWVVVTGNGRYAYTANTGSKTISGFSISTSGEVALLNANGVSGNTGTSPADMALSNNSRFLFARNGGSNSISLFEVETSGSLTNIGTVNGLPSGAIGLAAK